MSPSCLGKCRSPACVIPLENQHLLPMFEAKILPWQKSSFSASGSQIPINTMNDATDHLLEYLPSSIHSSLGIFEGLSDSVLLMLLLWIQSVVRNVSSLQDVIYVSIFYIWIRSLSMERNSTGPLPRQVLCSWILQQSIFQYLFRQLIRRSYQKVW